MIVRHDMDLESLGEMAQLPDDISPLKIGSRGKHKGAGFEVIGRLKVGWSEGYWNEWYVSFENGRYGWLAEAMGFFMLSSEVKETGKVPPLKSIDVGKVYEVIPSKKFFVDDIKETVCIGSEGELPFKAFKGRKTTSVDLSDHLGEFASIEYSHEDGISLYIGRYVEFEELQLTNLRDLASDIKKVRAAGVFKCPSCGGPFSMLTPGLTASAACKYCGSVIDTTNQTLSLLSKAEKKMKHKPLIPIGSKGKLFGTEWEVTGYVLRSDKSGSYPWDEYLLFNPYKGFRWLTTYKGHWNYVEMTRIRPVKERDGSSIKFNGKNFKKFLVGKAKVNYVLGEFYWRVKIGEMVDVADYISPPEMLSSESDKSEEVWSLGRYIEPKVIGDAFGIKEGMPAKEGVAANQPSPYGQKFRHPVLAFLGFAFLLTTLQIYFAVAAPGKIVHSGEYVYSQTAQQQQNIVSPSFDIPGNSDNLEVALNAPVQNDWLEASINLINEKTNEDIEITREVEYYSGTDSDGAWTEGNRNSDIVISSVPGGRYHLIIQPVSSTEVKGDKKFSIVLRRGVATWCNYFLALVLLLIYPLFVWCRGSKFEQNRWAESDLYPGSDDDTDEDDDKGNEEEK